MADATTSNSEELDQKVPSQADTAAETTEEQSEETETTSTADTDTASDGSKEHAEQTKTGEEAEDEFFDPKQVPPELIPAYKQMQRAFVQKTQDLAEKRRELENQGATKKEAIEATAEQADDIEAEVLQEMGINPATLNPETLQVMKLMIGVSKKIAGRQVSRAVAPIHAEAMQKQIDTFFDQNPDAENYRTEMAKIDRRTGEKLSLHELYTLASNETRAKAKTKEQTDRATARRLNNTESTGSTATTVAKPSGSPFDTMLDESRKRRLP